MKLKIFDYDMNPTEKLIREKNLTTENILYLVYKKNVCENVTKKTNTTITTDIA